ncbi:hypothetical protein [Methylomonas sp. MgM2]
MAEPNNELDAWLAGEDLFAANDLSPENWVAGFDVDRQLVEFKLGPVKRLFLRPDKFTKRFYHKVHPLKIESWPYRSQVKLFDDFCAIEIALDLRFQATLEYVRRNAELIEGINQHIRNLYLGVIEDKINQELSKLADGSWVQNGLTQHENRLAISVCEVLTQQHIQAEAVCHMFAEFAEFPEVQLGKDSIYLHVLKKTFELNQQKSQERLRQQRLNEQQAILAKQQESEHLKQLSEMQRVIQLQEAEAQIQLLLEKERQLTRQHEVEVRIHAEQVAHEQNLKTISFETELEVQQQLEAKQRLIELERLDERLAHETLVEERKTLAEIQRRRLIKQHWQQAEQLDTEQDQEAGDEQMETK